MNGEPNKSKRKKLKDTKVGKWLKENAPKVLDTVGELLPDNGALGVVKNLIDRDDSIPQDKKSEFQRLEFELELEDRKSARSREVEVKKTGDKDIMMMITGIVGLISFVFTIYAVVYIPSVKENELFIHLMGMIEGVVIGNIFAYYYGTSVKNK